MGCPPATRSQTKQAWDVPQLQDLKQSKHGMSPSSKTSKKTITGCPSAPRPQTKQALDVSQLQDLKRNKHGMSPSSKTSNKTSMGCLPAPRPQIKQAWDVSQLQDLKENKHGMLPSSKTSNKTSMGCPPVPRPQHATSMGHLPGIRPQSKQAWDFPQLQDLKQNKDWMSPSFWVFNTKQANNWADKITETDHCFKSSNISEN